MNEREQQIKEYIADAFNEVQSGERLMTKAKIWNTLPLSEFDISHFEKTVYFWSTVPTETGNVTGFWIGESMKNDVLFKMLVIIEVSPDVFDWLRVNVYHINV